MRFNNPEGIKCYAELLERTLVTIEDINFCGSLDTMMQLVSKLPHEWKRIWMKEFLKLEKGTGEVSGFSCFVTCFSDEVNSLYGHRVLVLHSS